MSHHHQPTTASDWKDVGNQYYNRGMNDEAIVAYTKAIQKNPGEPSYFTNRALCFLSLKKWSQAEEDSRKAIELDKKNVKGNYFLGKILVQKGLYDEAIKALTRAHESMIAQNLFFGDEITSLLRLARREKFSQEEEKRINQEIELQSYLNELIDQDMSRKLENTKDDGDEISEEKRERIIAYASDSKRELNDLFAKVDERRQKREIPDYFCGKISFELLKDPVITPSGITYDREHIKDHLRRVGHFDPVTREPLQEDKLIPNLALREALDDYVAKNEWAALDLDY